MEVFENATHDVTPAGLAPEEAGYWIGFNRVLGIGPVKFRLLLDYFQNDLAAAWGADSQELARAGLHQKMIDDLPIFARESPCDSSMGMRARVPYWSGDERQHVRMLAH